MKRLLSILGAIGFTGATASTVVSCQKNKIPLSSVISVTDLGPIQMANNYPTFAELITAIQAKNPGSSAINGENVRLYGQPSSTSARLEGIRDYQNFVTVTYTKGTGTTPVETDLSKLIANTDLGAIAMATADKPTAAEILKGVIAKNPKASNLTTNNFTTSNVTGTSATLTGKNGYTGSANVTYTRETNLTNIITNTNLGKIIMTKYPDGPTADEALQAIKDANPSAASLTTNDFQFSGTPSNTAATISGKGAYSGNVNLTYSLQNDITKLITTTSLGAITMAGATPTIDELITAIKAKNPNAAGLSNTTLTLRGNATSTQATVQGAAPYMNSVALTYTKA